MMRGNIARKKEKGRVETRPENLDLSMSVLLKTDLNQAVFPCGFFQVRLGGLLIKPFLIALAVTRT